MTMQPRDLPESWPFRSAARRLRVTPHDWWLIDTGPKDAPAILLLHGLGASGHSFRRMIPGLAALHRVLVPDLPGQGLTRAGARNRLGLEPMAEDLTALCAALEAPPAAIVGHSAGAAIALQMAVASQTSAVVGLNAALGSFDGAAGVMFPMLARGLAAMPFAATAFARMFGTESQVNRLLAGTGSPLDSEGRAQYMALVRDSTHVAGALGMMAQWRQDGLMQALPSLQTPALLVGTTEDRAVPCKVSREAAPHMPACDYMEIPGGHLAHEEAADGLSALILTWLYPATGEPKIV
jgi:magnesium chelatase accessory protein